MIILFILNNFSFYYLLILLGENCCWSLLEQRIKVWDFGTCKWPTIRWPTTITAKPKTSQQKQNTSRRNQILQSKNQIPHGKNKIPHDKTKNLTTKPKTSRQNQILHSKKQIPHGKSKYSWQNQSYFAFAMKYLVLP